MNISKERKEQSVDYICGGIENVIKTCGKRDPGSSGERKAQEMMAEELRKYSDNVTVEDFKLNPKSFMGWVPITVTISLISFILYFFMPILTLILLVLAVIPMLSQFVLYKQLIDPLFEEKISCNVMAVKKPKGEVKRRIIFNGHTDAAHEWTLNHKFGGVGFALGFGIAVIGLVYLFAASVISLIINGIGMQTASGASLVLGLIALVFSPFWLVMYKFTNWKVIVDGANDNLTACYMSMVVLKTLSEENIELENTEVWAMLSGSEEAGLRGAKAFAKAHKDDFNDCETIIIPMETLREVNHISIYSKDLNGLVKTDKDVCALLKKAGRSVGIEIPYATVTVGSTDAAAFTQGGFKSACLAALDHNLRDYYHTRRDTYDNLDKDCLGVVYDIVMSTLRIYDEEGLENLPLDAKK